MSRLAVVRRVLPVLAACVLLAARADAATQRLAADFDGDGTTDWVAIDGHEPSVLHVWLSRTGTANIIRSQHAVVRIAAHDLDGDHRPELIATEDVSHGVHAWRQASAIHVWKQDARRGLPHFHPLPQRLGPPRALSSPHHRSVDDGDPADDTSETGSEPLNGPSSAVVGKSVILAPPFYVRAGVWRHAPALSTSCSSAPSAPRPPPSSPLA